MGVPLSPRVPLLARQQPPSTIGEGTMNPCPARTDDYGQEWLPTELPYCPDEPPPSAVPRASLRSPSPHLLGEPLAEREEAFSLDGVGGERCPGKTPH